MRQVTLSIESDIDNVPLVAVAVHRICEHLGANSTEAGEIELCMTEAVTNAIRHAYRNAHDKIVSVTVMATAGGIQCDVCDQGQSMPAANVKTLAKGPEDTEFFDDENSRLAEHGRGLKIIASLMDEVSYLREGTANCLRMQKKIGSKT